MSSVFLSFYHGCREVNTTKQTLFNDHRYKNQTGPAAAPYLLEKEHYWADAGIH